MSYFNKFPTVKYDFFDNNSQTTIPDIFRQVRVVDKRFESATAYQLYEIGEDRPDQLSYKLYGTTDYHWTFFLINDTLSNGLEGWPMTHIQLTDHIDQTYKGHTITLYRGKDDPINENSIHGSLPIGSTITGLESGVSAVVTGRNPKVNQVVIEFEGNGRFQSGEILNSSDGFSISHNYEVKAHKQSVAYYAEDDGALFNNWENVFLPDYAVSYKESEEIKNAGRVYIRVLRKDYVEEFAIAYRRLLNE